MGATGQMSAAGIRLQRERGIDDLPDLHIEDLVRISRGTANPGLVRRAVDNAAANFDWLMDEGFEPLPHHPVTRFGHESYRLPRYYWGSEGGITIKNVLVPIIERLEREGAITIWLNRAVTTLASDAAGAIAGASARRPDGLVRDIAAQTVLLACGGYAGHPRKCVARNGVPQYNSSPWSFSRGAGLALGESVGGYARGAENLFCNVGALFNTDDFPAKPVGRIEHFPEQRKPWEIYVNALGQRFVREDIDSVDAREMALFHQPDQRYWIVFDHCILMNAPPIVADWTREQVYADFDEAGPEFLTAESLEALSDGAGIDADGLVRSVAGFNYGVQTGNDFFGREHHPLPIAEGPFHAIRMQASSISSSIGLAVDDELRVIRRDGARIANLHATGEILGSSQTMGKAACGGMMVTPAMTFGRLLGDHLIPLELGR